MEAIIGLAGVILGFALSELATWWRQTRADKEQAQAVRTVIYLEIDYNLARLRSFWEQVNQPDSETNPVMVRQNKASRLINLPTPYWTHRAWESQMPLLPTALRDEVLIRKVHAHYALIETLVSIHNKLISLKVEQDQEMAKVNTPFPALVFQRNGASLMGEYEAGVNKLIEIGNPLVSLTTMGHSKPK
jgi:hypothetical protein